MASPPGAEGGMASARSRFLLAAAAVLGGLLAGLDVDRTLVAMPAWQAVGPTAWAEFSRHADLGKGLFLYPLEAIGTFLLLMAAATSLRLEGAGWSRVPWELWAAIFASAASLLLTLIAAPIMLGIRDAADPASLQTALAGFRFWGDVRGALQLIAFVATVSALSRPG